MTTPTNNTGHPVSPPASPKEPKTQPKKSQQKQPQQHAKVSTGTTRKRPVQQRPKTKSTTTTTSSKRSKQTTTTAPARQQAVAAPAPPVPKSPPLPPSLQQQQRQQGSGDDKAKQDDTMIKLMVKLNNFYENHMKEPPQFMTFVLVGMQSSGKSTFLERMINLPLNIVQSGTGSRCPVDITCSNEGDNHDVRVTIMGNEFNEGKEEVHVEVSTAFASINTHQQKLNAQQRFSNEPLRVKIQRGDIKPCRVVDLPGIISNKSTGEVDHREEIKDMIRTIMTDPRARLCVVLEAKEYDTNPIIDFLDESFPKGRESWIRQAIFVMPKFDNLVKDTRTASRANKFFEKFFQNGIVPYLMYTPNLDNEDLQPEELYEERKKNLAEAGSVEYAMFTGWVQGHEADRIARKVEECLDARMGDRLGFSTAHSKMTKELINNIRSSLPDVEKRLKRDIAQKTKEREVLEEKHDLTMPDKIKKMIGHLLSFLDNHMDHCLAGKFSEVHNFREKCQTLKQELDAEKESDWVNKELNFRSTTESSWRDEVAIANFDSRIQSDASIFGRLQVRRATNCFRAMMIQKIPTDASDYVLLAKSIGYGHNAATQISKHVFQEITRPGINFLVKHVGNIFRQIFEHALSDANDGYEKSSTLCLVPDPVKARLTSCFEQMLWEVMVNAAKQIHSSIEPLCCRLHQDLPKGVTSGTSSAIAEEQRDSQPAEGAEKTELNQKLVGIQKVLLDEDNKRAGSQEFILTDKRATMMTDEEASAVATTAFEYLRHLMANCALHFDQQVDSYLYNAFRRSLKDCFYSFAAESNWEEILAPDSEVLKSIDNIKKQENELSESLREVLELLDTV